MELRDISAKIAAEVNRGPGKCPHCNAPIKPVAHEASVVNKWLQVVYQCPQPNCGLLFLGLFVQEEGGVYSFRGTFPPRLELKSFPPSIKEISPAFVQIYQQASRAEQMGWGHICGSGYGKALEFLVKDYLISKNPDRTPEIKGKLLGACIEDYVEDNSVKDCAARAIWLRNNETHYERRWGDKGLKDLKQLIDLTVAWISNDVSPEKLKADMPKPSSDRK